MKVAPEEKSKTQLLDVGKGMTVNHTVKIRCRQSNNDRGMGDFKKKKESWRNEPTRLGGRTKGHWKGFNFMAQEAL